MSVEEYNCIRCAAPWPQQFLKCPVCNADYATRVRYEASRFAREAMEAAVTETKAAFEETQKEMQSVETAQPVVEQIPMRRFITSMLVYGDVLIALANDGTGWEHAGKGWERLACCRND